MIYHAIKGFGMLPNKQALGLAIQMHCLLRPKPRLLTRGGLIEYVEFMRGLQRRQIVFGRYIQHFRINLLSDRIIFLFVCLVEVQVFCTVGIVQLSH